MAEKTASKQLHLCNTTILRSINLRGVVSMAKVQIPPSEFTEIPRLREIIKMLPEEIRVCSKHGDEVDIKLGEFLPNQGSGVPFGEAYWEGCSVEAIARVIDAV